MQICSFYNDHGLLGDGFIKPQLWCNKKWQQIIAPIDSCWDAAGRIAAVVPLVFATVGAYVLGMIGVVVKGASFFMPSCTPLDQPAFLWNLSRGLDAQLIKVTDNGVQNLQQCLDEMIAPRAERFLAAKGCLFPGVRFAIDVEPPSDPMMPGAGSRGSISCVINTGCRQEVANIADISWSRSVAFPTFGVTENGLMKKVIEVICKRFQF